MDIKKVREFVGADWQAVQERISGSLHSDISLLDMTNASILSNSGKQMRPLLTVLFARACSGGKTTDATVRYASASELLHNATLLHDDVADGSLKRRGAPTIMSLMGPSVSVLLGDYWLVKAMDLIIDADDSIGETCVIKIFSKTLKDLAEGEMLQLQKAQNGDANEEDYLRIIYSKTASLFEASCFSAAISVGSPDVYIQAARDYSVSLGIAFQIQDDILDYAGTEAVGKPLGADILEQKITMPLLGALKQVDASVAEGIIKKVEEITEHPEYREVILDFVREHGGVDYAASQLSHYVEQAVKALDVLPDSKAKEYLVELAYYTGKRTK